MKSPGKRPLASSSGLHLGPGLEGAEGSWGWANSAGQTPAGLSPVVALSAESPHKCPFLPPGWVNSAEKQRTAAGHHAALGWVRPRLRDINRPLQEPEVRLSGCCGRGGGGGDTAVTHLAPALQLPAYYMQLGGHGHHEDHCEKLALGGNTTLSQSVIHRKDARVEAPICTVRVTQDFSQLADTIGSSPRVKFCQAVKPQQRKRKERAGTADGQCPQKCLLPWTNQVGPDQAPLHRENSRCGARFGERAAGWPNLPAGLSRAEAP